MYECNTCSNDELTKYNKGVSIIMNFNLRKYLYKQKHGSPIKKDKINDTFNIIYNFFGKVQYIVKLFILGKTVGGKIAWIEKLLVLKKLLALKNCLHWKIVCIEKSFALKKLLSIKLLLALKN